MCLPAQAVEIDLKCLISVCLEAGAGAGRRLEPGQAAELPDPSWRIIGVPPSAQDGPVQTNPPKESSPGGAGHRQGAALVLQMERNAGRKNPHLKMRAEVKVRNAGGAERACTI